MNIHEFNSVRWARMLKLLPAFAIGGWFLTTAGWHAALAVAATVIFELAVVCLCERELTVMRMTGAATVFALPGLMVSSVLIHADLNRLVVLAILFGAYITVLVLAWRGRPKMLMSSGWWSTLFILGVVAFVLVSRYWPDAVSSVRWIVQIIRIFVSGDWSI